ncbi:flavo protein [Patellaria atrata CBS 101060]|uniref:Flavo protein n=1 Tax=Patellaria atrata CBS 101060 TaxID=1346257 RepID=A0A9P4VRG3_9PEZI|nr:flavo protein [Patellaria atrata CBS 101060]
MERLTLPENSKPLHIVFASTGAADIKLRDQALTRLQLLPNVLIQNAESHYLHLRQCDPRLSLQRMQRRAAALVEWADFLILAPIDADNLAKMLHGMTDNLVLEIIRSWNVTKKILLVPGMSTSMWENPMTKKQLSKLRKWNWVRVVQPMLWSFEKDGKRSESWEGMEEVMEIIQTQVDLKTIGHDMHVAVSPALKPNFSQSSHNRSLLPPELWSIIFDFTGDWELAKALDIYTTLPVPPEWQQTSSAEGPQSLMSKLEWIVLTGTVKDVDALFKSESSPRWISKLCIRLIMRFGLTPLLSYLETSHKDLFWSTFGHAFLPDKASSVFGRVEILEYWRTSAAFLSKEYTVEALDGASRAGFVHVLEWWRHSGLPLKYTDAALEQASIKGHIDVLEWWKRASTTDSQQDADDSRNSFSLSLKPGKSLAYAAQSGSLPTLAWWASSGIPLAHEDLVARQASNNGHVHLLEFWHQHRGDKMLFDNQVLVGATKMGHVAVLEWWKWSGLRVQYKTCDVEEALEDGIEGRRGEEVRRWWARNGLNLAEGTSEWMRTKVLGQRKR